jgi:hypothetical protein
MRFCNTWQQARHAPHASTHNQMAWSSAISKRSRITYEKSSQHTRGIGMLHYPSFPLLTGNPLTTLKAWLHDLLVLCVH